VVAKHIKHCIDADLIFEEGAKIVFPNGGDCLYGFWSIDITPRGYDFLSSIKKDEI